VPTDPPAKVVILSEAELKVVILSEAKNLSAIFVSPASPAPFRCG
jgi:hypothetical protein